MVSSATGGCMRLMVTGGAGFIGSAAVCHAVLRGYDVLTVDKLTYAGRRDTLAEIAASPRHHFMQADVADKAYLLRVLEDPTMGAS